jgi:hypothetical protein
MKCILIKDHSSVTAINIEKGGVSHTPGYGHANAQLAQAVQ